MAVQDLSDVTPDTTSEDIAAYAAQVMQEVEADRQGEPDEKSDAQIIAEHSGIVQSNDTPAEKNSSSDTAIDDGEDSGTASESPKWLSDDVKAEAAAYGIDESELAEFASREEFNRALKLFDKAALEAGRKAMVESEEKVATRNEKGQFAKKEEPKADQSKGAAPKDGRYQVSLNPEMYDEEIISEFGRLTEHYESRFAALEAHFMEASAKAEEQQFDNFIDSLGHADLFGTTGKESEKELERRRDLNVAVKAQMIGLEKLGRPAELSKQLISRVANMVFAEELSKKLLKQQTRKISRQSDGRLGGSPTKPQPPSDNPADHYDRLYKEMQRS